MKKTIYIIIIVLVCTGIAMNAIMDQQFSKQYTQGIPLSQERFALSDCLQAIIWIIVALLSGFSLIFAPDPAIKLLKRIQPKKANKFTVYSLGVVLLASVPLTIYSTFFVGTRGCNVFIALCCK